MNARVFGDPCIFLELWIPIIWKEVRVLSLFGENPVHFAFDISAVIVCMTVLFFSMISRRNEKAQNKIFTALIIIIMMNSVCEIVTNYLEPISESSQLIFRLMDHTRLLYFLLHAALCPFFFFYVIVGL